MDALQVVITSLGLLALIVLLVLGLCHRLGPKASSWICSRSSHEEKIGLSKSSRLFNANGYLIHSSGSEILLSSTGSFKRFESIDRDYKDVSQIALTSPTLIISAKSLPHQTDNIPPQPLRPAPAPISLSRDRKLKQQSFDNLGTISSSGHIQSSSAIPRPVARRQFSSPAGTLMPINLSRAVAEISIGPKSCSTNPFADDSFTIPENDLESSKALASCPAILTEEQETVSGKPIKNNPFIPNWIELTTSDLSTRNNNNNNNNTNKTPTPTKLPSSSPTPNTPKTTPIEHKFRNRSRSEAEIELDDTSPAASIHFANCRRKMSQQAISDSDSNTSLTNTTNPFKSPGHLHKTLSETHLMEHISMSARSGRSLSQQWQFGRALTRQGSNQSMGGGCGGGGGGYSTVGSANGSQSSIVSTGSVPLLTRAESCESMSSVSSVRLMDLEQPVAQVTGMLCVGLQYDKNSQTNEGIQLFVTVMEAKELIRPSNSAATPLDTFVRMYLVPDETEASQTKLFKDSFSPSYNETFSFWLNRRRNRRSLWFHLYDSGAANTLLGEAEMHLTDLMHPTTTWLSLSDSKNKHTEWGDLMFSLCYLPTAERLTVVVVKGRNLKMVDESEPLENVFVKVYLLKNNRKVSKKKTSLKRADNCPIYNESMIFSVPPAAMAGVVQIRLTVCSNNAQTDSSPDSSRRQSTTSCPSSNKVLGHIIVGGNTTGKALRHWNQMLISLRKPVGMWHPIRRTIATSRR